jgi:hypothetical protein
MVLSGTTVHCAELSGAGQDRRESKCKSVASRHQLTASVALRCME